MTQYQTDTGKHQHGSSSTHLHENVRSNSDEENDRVAIVSGYILDRSDSIIYAVVGISFLLASVLALGYTFWQFSVTAFIELPHLPLLISPTDTVHASDPTQISIAATAIVDLISGLLLVLIIVEILGTVIHYLKSHTTSLRPFLYIGIISATRSILSIGVKLSVGSHENFNNAMIELGVSAAVIVALAITIRLLSRLE